MTCILCSSFAYAEQLTDPTMPESYRPKSEAVTSSQVTEGASLEWVLNSTLISPRQKVAIINGKQLEIGEEINGATVNKIDHQYVELSYKNEIIILSLHKSFISQIKSLPLPTN